MTRRMFGDSVQIVRTTHTGTANLKVGRIYCLRDPTGIDRYVGKTETSEDVPALERSRAPSTSSIKDLNMSTGNFENVVVDFKRALALLQNAETCQACKSE